MRAVNKGPHIRVKENPNPFGFKFFDGKCCKIKQFNECECPGTGICSCTKLPDRCKHHDYEYTKWKRNRKMRKKLIKNFDKKRHCIPKMITFGLKGLKHLSNNNDIIDDQSTWREELRTKFAKLRRNKWWKDHVDGGIWFYEGKITALDKELLLGENDGHARLKIHPHFHCIVIGPKNLAGKERNFQELNSLFEEYDLGKPSVTLPKDKTGRPIKSIHKASWYATKYVTKDNQINGKNRGQFGKLFHRK